MRIIGSAATVGAGYLLGGVRRPRILGLADGSQIIPLIPYFAVTDATTGLFISIGVTAVALLTFVRLEPTSLF